MKLTKLELSRGNLVFNTGLYVTYRTQTLANDQPGNNGANVPGADPATLSYSHDRKMRPDVTVHIPVYDQENFGHPVDEKIRQTLREASELLESVGVR